MHKGELANINPPRITTEPFSAQFENLGELVKMAIFDA